MKRIRLALIRWLLGKEGADILTAEPGRVLYIEADAAHPGFLGLAIALRDSRTGGCKVILTLSRETISRMLAGEFDPRERRNPDGME